MNQDQITELRYKIKLYCENLYSRNKLSSDWQSEDEELLFNFITDCVNDVIAKDVLKDVDVSESPKPPLSVIPECIGLEYRNKELIEALDRLVIVELNDTSAYYVWSQELIHNMKRLEQLNKQS